MVEALIATNQYSDALSALRELAIKVSDWSARGLVERSLVARLAQECGIDFSAMWDSGRRRPGQMVNNGDENGDLDEDEIQEEMGDLYEEHVPKH